VIFKAKWLITTGFAVLLGFCLWRFFGIKLWRVVAAAVPVAVLALLLPNHPIFAFAAGSAGLASLTFIGGAELKDWRDQTWSFAKQILPLLFGGVLAAGFFLGSPASKDAGMVPSIWIQALVGDSPQALLNLIGRDGASLPWLNLLWPVWTNFFASFTGALMYFATLTEVPILRGLIDSGMGQGPALALLLAGPALSLPSMLVINSILGPKKTLTYIGLVVVMAAFTGMMFGIMMN
jgi:uncharacterized membrane protein YraQ (UPF0718 family)